nr:hypothetical protein [Brevibacillus laterosporus]
MHMGFLITDTIPLSIYQYDREKQVWISESPDGATFADLELEYNINKRGANVLTITISVSGRVRNIDVEDALPKTEYDQLDVWIYEPELKRVLYKEQVQAIQRLVKDKTETLYKRVTIGIFISFLSDQLV